MPTRRNNKNVVLTFSGGITVGQDVVASSSTDTITSTTDF
jgi:hypothetical protein